MTDFIEEKLLSLNAAALFEGDDFGNNPNLRYCRDFATFAHTDGCEYILHIGQDAQDDAQYWVIEAARMHRYGCTSDFIDAYIQAHHLGAVRLLLWN